MLCVGVLLAAAVFVGSALITLAVREIARRRRLFDRPNERSAHVTPTPRLGGIGVVATFLPAGLAAAFAATSDAAGYVALGSTAGISVLGLWDDLSPLRARTRFGAQTLAAVALTAVAWDRLPSAWSLFGAHVPHWLLGLLTVLWLVWLTNLYNFMDGIDGLAAGQAILAAAGIAVVACGSAQLVALLAILLACSAAGFLLFNFPPASIFMGDVGSTAIGFFFGALPVIAPAGTLPVEAVAVCLALFILDATVTLIRRLARGEKFFQAHRSHFYQRPLALGVRHLPITLSSYIGMAAVAGLGVAYLEFGLVGRLASIGAAVAIFAIFATIVVHLERRRGQA